MRYGFKVRVLQKYRSWIDVWGNQVIAASPSFEWMIGKTVEQALDWVNRKSLYGSYRIEPLPVNTAEHWQMIKRYAQSIATN